MDLPTFTAVEDREAIMSIAIRREDGIDDPLLYSPHGVGHSPLVAAELSTNASPTVPDVAAPPMAPGVGGFNIDRPAPGASPVEGDVASEDMRGVVPELFPNAPPTVPGVAARPMAPWVGGFNIDPPAPRASPVEGDVASEDRRGVVPELSPIAPPMVPGVAARPMAPWVGGFNIDPPAPRASPVEGDVASEDRRGVVPVLPPIAPPTVPEIAPAAAMVPGVGVPNIDLTPPRVRPVDANIALKDMRGRWLLDPDPVPQPMWIGKLSFVFSLVAIVGFGATLLELPNEVRMDADGIAAVVSPLPENLSRSRPSVQPARLVVQSQRGYANEPLPLGVSLADASGGESLTVVGLVTGSRLSAGMPLGLTGWQLSARDLGNAFANAPKDFVGVMEAVIDLRSASDQPMDVQVVRLEWIRKKEDRLTPQLDPSKPPPLIQPLDPEEIATLIKRGEDFLKTGDIAAAQILLKRAANAGNAQAALEVGMTFDPVFLAQRGVLGFAPDVAQAREWYDKAMKLGSTEASRHLERLADMGR